MHAIECTEADLICEGLGFCEEELPCNRKIENKQTDTTWLCIYFGLYACERIGRGMHKKEEGEGFNM